MAISAFAAIPGAPPKLDLVGPTVEDDIRRAIHRYGAEAVKEAVKAATKPKRGRKREPDWPELYDVIKADALSWLAGNDPFAERSNYAIAKAFAERNPGHSIVSTHKRIERKLSKGPYDRRWYTLVIAERLGHADFPYTAHLRTLRALADSFEGTRSEMWKSMLDSALSTLADYGVREGKLPPEEMSFRDIEEAVRTGGLAALIAPPNPGGLFGLQSSGQSRLGSILSDAAKGSKD